MKPSFKVISFVLLFFVLLFTTNYSQIINKEYFLKRQLIPRGKNDINFVSFISDLNNKKNKVFSDNKLIIDSIIVYNTNATKMKYNYTYDSKGRIISFIIFDLQNDLWVNIEKITFTYDSLSNKISTLSEFWNGFI